MTVTESEALARAREEVQGVTVRLAVGGRSWEFPGITPAVFDLDLLTDFAEIADRASEMGSGKAVLAGLRFARRVLECLAGPEEARTILRSLHGAEAAEFVEQLLGAFPQIMGADPGEASASPGA